MDKQKQRSLLRRYVVAVLAPAFMAGVMYFTWPFFEGSLASPYLLAVMFCAWYGGLGPGLVSVLVSLLVADYFFIVPYFSLGGPTHSDFVQLLVLTMVGLCTSILSELTRKAKQLAEINLAATKESEDRFSSLVAATSQVVWAASPEGNITADVPAWRNITGQSFEEIMGAGWLNAVHPSDRERVEQAWSGGVRQKKSYQTEGRIRQQDGSYRYYSIRGVPVFEENGTTVHEWVDAAKDITERRQAEDLLRQSENQLLEAQHITHVGSWTWDLQTNARTWSEELYLIFGLDRKSSAPSLHSSLIEFVHPDDQELVNKAVQTSISTKQPCSFSYRIIRPDGAERIIHSQGNVVADDRGNPIRMFGTAQDITERWRAENSLREAERKYRDIFENASEGIFQSTPEGRYLAANPALARMHGFDSPEELIRDRNDISRQIYVDPERREEFKRLLEEQGTVRGFEHEIFRKDGSKIWISVNARAVRNEQRKIEYYEGTAQDISERKRAEEALLKLAAIVGFSDDAIIGKTMEGTITSWNKGAERIYGYLADEVIGRPISILIPPDRADELPAILEKIARGQPLEHYETERVRKDGQIISVSLTVSPVKNADGIVIGASTIARDITPRKRAAEKLQTSERRLAAAQSIAHLGHWEWNTKTNAVNWSDELYRIVGLRAQECGGTYEAFIACVHPDDRAQVVAVIEASLKDLAPHRYCYRVVRPDGSVRFIQAIARVEVDAAGFPTRWFCTAQDITESKQAEEALRASEGLFRTLVNASSQSVWRYRPGLSPIHQIDSANVAWWCEFTGQTEAQRTADGGMGWLDAVHEADRAAAKRIWLNIVNASEPVEAVYRVRRQDGEWRWLSVCGMPYLFDAQGVVTEWAGTITDITERKQAEEALRESEERYRDLVENSRELICTHDLNGLVLSANPASAAALGYDPDTFVGKKSIRDILAPEVRDQFDEYMARLCRDRATTGIMCVQTKSGERRIWEYYNSLRTEGVATPIVRGMARDITEQRRAQKALHESEERYRELFENAREALYVHDLSGRYTSFNRAAEQLSGYPRDEIIGKHFSNFVAPAHLKYVRENFCKKLDDEGETTYEIDLITKDRRRVPVEVSSRLIYENGKPVGVQGVARDITDRKRADEARARFELIVESSDDAIIGKTLDGTIVSWNSGAEKIYGYSAREVIGCHISILVPPDRNDEVPRHLERIRRGESISHYETLGRRKDGKLINVSLTISPIRDAVNKIVGVSTIARDVTKSKQAEKALQTFSRRLIEAQEAERQSIARELHDEIGQVLTAVRINLQSLQRSGPALQASPIEESLSIVDEALDRVRELSLNLRPSVLDNLGLSSALRWYVDRYARRSGIVADLSNEIEDGLRLRVEVETACFRIVQEALTNVARHAQATQVSVRLRRSNGNLELKIQDNGVGFNVGALLKDSPPAWALGLRGMEERAVAAQGSFKIDSAPMRGTEVRASFPLKDGS